MSAASIKRFAESLRQLPKVLGIKVAAEAAPGITEIARRSFNAGESPDGIPWEPAADGSKVTLRKTGAMFRTLRYVAIGTKLRVALGVKYAKYQIGKRPVFPRQGGLLPDEYRRELGRITAAVAAKELGT